MSDNLNVRILKVFKESYRRSRYFIRDGDVTCMTAEDMQDNLKGMGYEVSLGDVDDALEDLAFVKSIIRLTYPYGSELHPCYMISKSLAKEFDLEFYKNSLSKLCSAKTTHQKAKALESAIEDMIYLFDGLKVKGKNVRTKVEEIDIIVGNESKEPFIVQFGDPFLVECKNWRKPVGKKEVVVFVDMLRSKNLRCGILVALNGITGNENSSAMRKLLEARRDGITTIVLDRDNLDGMARGEDPIETLRHKHYEQLKS